MDPLDAALDRELRSLLAAEPSPDFVARIRARIAEEPAPSWWQWSWSLAAVAAVFVAAVAAAVLARFGVAPVGMPADTPFLAARTIVEASGALAVPLVSRRLNVVSGFGRTDAGSRRTAAVAETEPEVLIDPREARALRRFMEGVSADQFDRSVLESLPPALSAAEMAVPPLSVDPISAPDEGVRQ